MMMFFFAEILALCYICFHSNGTGEQAGRSWETETDNRLGRTVLFYMLKLYLIPKGFKEIKSVWF